jgi:hypothetical protein
MYPDISNRADALRAVVRMLIACSWSLPAHAEKNAEGIPAAIIRYNYINVYCLKNKNNRCHKLLLRGMFVSS